MDHSVPRDTSDWRVARAGDSLARGNPFRSGPRSTNVRSQQQPGGRTAFGGIGIAAAALGVGVGHLVGVFLDGSPILAVGRVAVDGAPSGLKQFAVRSFGNNDKLVLIIGVLVVLLVLAAAAGLLYRRVPRAGAGLIALLGLAGALAATLGTGTGPVAAIPSVLAAVLGVLALWWLARLYRKPATPRAPHPKAATGPSETAGGDEQEQALPNRRGALSAGIGMLVVGAAGGAGGQLLGSGNGSANQAVRLPVPAKPAPALPSGHRFEVAGLTPFRTSNAKFYRVDTDLSLPRVDPHDWTLRIHGSVDRPIELSYRELLRKPLIERDMTLCCVSNEVGGPYVSTTRWLGVSLPRLLRDAGVHSGADQVLSTSTDGMTIGTPTDLVLDGREALLVVGMNGKPLPTKHGFPVRIVVPGLFGYASATKWLSEIKLTSFAAEQAYWVKRGYAKVGTAKTASRIDVPRPFAQVKPGKVTVAGIAWALHRGIAAVEVRVDGGAWQRARLATDTGPELWRQWRFDWDAEPGQHRIEVRATDGNGHQQPGERTGVFPSGATGWHSVHVTVSG